VNPELEGLDIRINPVGEESDEPGNSVFFENRVVLFISTNNKVRR